MTKFPGCEEHKLDKKIVLRENQSKIVFLNPTQISVLIIKVDGCVIKGNQGLRCDYMLIPNPEIEIYVELKGRDILHAVKQLEATIEKLSVDAKKKKKLCFVVCTHYPKHTTATQNINIKFKKNFNASFQVKNKEYTYTL